MIRGFLDPLCVKPIGWANGRQIWETTAPCRYRSERLGHTLVILPEFRWDGASVPRTPLAWWVAGARALRPSAYHDHVYQLGRYLLEDGSFLMVEKETGDLVFHDQMEDDVNAAGENIGGTGDPKIRWAMYEAVHIFGRGSWKGRMERVRQLNPEWAEQLGVEGP